MLQMLVEWFWFKRSMELKNYPANTLGLISKLRASKWRVQSSTRWTNLFKGFMIANWLSLNTRISLHSRQAELASWKILPASWKMCNRFSIHTRKVRSIKRKIQQNGSKKRWDLPWVTCSDATDVKKVMIARRVWFVLMYARSCGYKDHIHRLLSYYQRPIWQNRYFDKRIEWGNLPTDKKRKKIIE